MAANVYQVLLVGAALYVLASDVWSAVQDSPRSADLRLGAIAISAGIELQ